MLPASSALAADAPAEGFGFAEVVRRAQELAARAYDAPPENLPKPLADLDYDRYREIRFRPEKAIWRDQGLPFQLQLFHLGLFYRHPVAINIVDGETVRRLAFSTEYFDYGRNELGLLPADLGFAGFRLHAPVNVPNYFDEVIVFLGASYFRAIGKGQVYGLSARGLAIDTALPSGEEFPGFREFWIRKPASDAAEIAIFALLDSRSLAGAYRFVVRPGDATEMAVTCRLFLRQDVAKLGIAPLTSMFLYGEDGTRRFDDFRPEVHDSDGLLMHSGTGEWIWRPLANPRRLRVSAYEFDKVHGFGLLQRDREFRSYEDLEALYHQRPSCWVEPSGDWGPGRVELVEIPSDQEKYDNVAAFWVPARPTKARDVLDFEYRLTLARKLPRHPPEGRVNATRTAPGSVSGARRFILDFVGGRLTDLKSGHPVELVVDASNGKVGLAVSQKNVITGGWRGFFDLDPGDAKLIELRAFLRLGKEALTETWSYQWSPA